MLRYPLMFMLAVLAGCGTTSTLRGEGDTSYVTLSHSKGGGIAGAFTGKTSVCKMSEHHPKGANPGHHYFLQMDGDKCFVEVYRDAVQD